MNVPGESTSLLFTPSVARTRIRACLDPASSAVSLARSERARGGRNVAATFVIVFQICDRPSSSTPPAVTRRKFCTVLLHPSHFRTLDASNRLDDERVLP